MWGVLARRISAAIGSGRCLPQDYELIVGGTPVWAGRMASPVRSYLQRHRGHDDLDTALALMRDSGVRLLLVVVDDDRRLTGIVSLDDLWNPVSNWWPAWAR